MKKCYKVRNKNDTINIDFESLSKSFGFPFSFRVKCSYFYSTYYSFTINFSLASRLNLYLCSNSEFVLRFYMRNLSLFRSL